MGRLERLLVVLHYPCHPRLVLCPHLGIGFAHVLLSKIQLAGFQFAHRKMGEVHLCELGLLLHLLQALGQGHGDQHGQRSNLEQGNWTSMMARFGHWWKHAGGIHWIHTVPVWLSMACKLESRLQSYSCMSLSSSGLSSRPDSAFPCSFLIHGELACLAWHTWKSRCRLCSEKRAGHSVDVPTHSNQAKTNPCWLESAECHGWSWWHARPFVRCQSRLPTFSARCLTAKTVLTLVLRQFSAAVHGWESRVLVDFVKLHDYQNEKWNHMGTWTPFAWPVVLDWLATHQFSDFQWLSWWLPCRQLQNSHEWQNRRKLSLVHWTQFEWAEAAWQAFVGAGVHEHPNWHLHSWSKMAMTWDVDSIVAEFVATWLLDHACKKPWKLLHQNLSE